MKLELQDAKGLTGVFIELPLEQLKEEIGLVSSSGAKPTETETQLKERQGKDAELEAKKSLVDRVSEWVDTRVIAEMVIDHLKSEGMPVTFEEAKEVWYSTLQMLGSHLAELKEKLAKDEGKTMTDFTPEEKAGFVIAWARGLAPEDKAIFAEAVGIPLAKPTEAEVAEVEAQRKAEDKEAEEPWCIHGKTERPGYTYKPYLDLSIKEA